MKSSKAQIKFLPGKFDDSNPFVKNSYLGINFSIRKACLEDNHMYLFKKPFCLQKVINNIQIWKPNIF